MSRGERFHEAPAVAGAAPVILTMTTTPSRIARIIPTLRSLLAQDMPARKLALNLPRRLARTDEVMRIPAHVRRFLQEHADRIEVHEVDDYGPATKIVPTLHRERDQHALVCWVDDDIIYPREMLRTFVGCLMEMQSRGTACAVSASGLRWKKDAPDADPQSPATWFEIVVDEACDIVEGFAGVMVRRGYFEDSFLDILRPAPSFGDIWSPGAASDWTYALMSDDLLVSLYLRRRGIVLLPVRTEQVSRDTLQHLPHGFEADALHRNPLTGERGEGNVLNYARSWDFIEELFAAIPPYRG